MTEPKDKPKEAPPPAPPPKQGESDPSRFEWGEGDIEIEDDTDA